MHAALWLVVTLGALAGSYLVLTAEFVAWVQVLIYVGAVVVLLLFGLMLTRAPIGALAGPRHRQPPLAAVAGRRRPRPRWSCWSSTRFRTALRRPATRRRRAAPPSVTGAALFRTWVLPFEVLSVLLLAALVGAIVLSRSTTGRRRAAATATPTPAAGRRFGGAG